MMYKSTVIPIFLLGYFVVSCVSQRKEGSKDEFINTKFGSIYKPKENPILRADSTFSFYCPINQDTIRWQKADVFNPAAVVRNDTVFMLFRAEDNPKAQLGKRTSRIGLAYSTNGLDFTKYDEPVLYPDSSEYFQYNYPGGCEDPRVVQTEDGSYVMAYTSWNYDVARLSIAFSKDLRTWEKKGPAFLKTNNGRFLDLWSKSGSMITKLEGETQILAKINGKYWMYWGEAFINLAWSENLADWYPLLDGQNELLQVVKTRKNKFDSNLTECGPPALLTTEGVVLLYNGKNATDKDADVALPKGTYSVGKIIFDKNDLTQVIYRSDTSIFKPTLPHETTGQYQSGTTFAEGLVYYRDKWHLYYGTADSYVGVAIFN